MRFGKLLRITFIMTFFLSTKAFSQSNWQLVVIPQANTSASNNKVSPQVYIGITSALTTQLVNNNFTVFDQSLLELKNCITKDCTIISDSNLLSLVQSYNFKAAQISINLAIVYQIDIFDETTSSVKGMRFNLSSYLVDLDSGERVESYSDSKKYNDIANTCLDECLIRWQTDKAYQLAQDAGYILSLKINRLPKRYRYELEFDRFAINELKQINVFLNSLSEKKIHIALSDFTVQKAFLNQQGNKQLTLTSLYHADELNQLLHNHFEQHALPVLIDFRQSINKFTIVKGTTKFDGLYIILLLVVLLLFGFFYYYLHYLNTNKRLKKVDRAIADKNYYLAYFFIDKTLVSITKNKLLKYWFEPNLLLIRESIDKLALPIRGNVIADKALAGTHIFTANMLELGKKSILGTKSRNAVDSFCLGYKLLSELGKQCVFIFEGNEYYLSDKGSKYACQFNDKRLANDQLVKITANSTLYMAIDVKQQLQTCQLKLDLSQCDSSALIMSLKAEPFQFLEHSSLGVVWPDFELDLNSRWILLGNSLALGVDAKGIIDIGCTNNSKVLAYLSYSCGFFIEPVKNGLGKLLVDSHEIYAKVPVKENTIINLAGCEFSLNKF
ncbi:hypothetical protein [Pseudoalteromonas denitrificans]|uniref:Uncharacterized protein n=1 Tax=Pseudoalteromonas denitrificans DSM 6059 TaxID=1123010 RepID=A0A1I1SIR4_9GAMM|nr:hypothetical protein [Pseudoalteromonas denitrificans]SFD43753.1 hypothetical protein SAMN02745724_04526 [Pseudoalteromonas denitrificans DSM 6059]